MASEDTVTIPPDIITDILPLFPAKSVGRFRCVSKDWLSQLSSPQFIKTHQNTINQNHIIFISPDLSLNSLPLNHHQQQLLSASPTNLNLKSPHDLNLFTFHGSCNGLVLASFNDLISDRTDHTLVVFNPTTKQLVTLPVSGFEMVDNLLEIDITYGFGYDSVNDDYKVVTVSYFHFNYLIPPDCMSVHVYSLKTNTWKPVTDSPYDHSYGKSVPGVLVNGFVHWFANKDDLQVIVAFNLADDKFNEVALPDVSIGSRIGSKICCRLVDFGGKLGIFFEVGGMIWLMNEYGVKESWTKIILHGFNDVNVVESILYDNGKMLLFTRDQMWMYDVEEGKSCRLVDTRDLKDFKVCGTYVESLVSPKFN
ncbi:F-box/kelch-repeat protein At3g06240-like [Rutidosis leptorrhynchoides]|uniref:F-box/kelch-repeat protein At3g06240-like n=1 Tax=Rutidosis leptorrhynchoides TaxID=125765 RepID=UPI003A990315